VSLAWSFPSCFGRLCSNVAVALAWLQHHFPSSKSFDCPLSSNYLANWYQESSQVQWLACHAWLGFGTLSICLLSLFTSSCCFFRATHVIHPCSSRRCPLSGAIEACATRLCLHNFSVGLILEPREGWIVTSSDVNSTPDESAKESSYIHVNGSHL